jgi:hypothetical protein
LLGLHCTHAHLSRTHFLLLSLTHTASGLRPSSQMGRHHSQNVRGRGQHHVAHYDKLRRLWRRRGHSPGFPQGSTRADERQWYSASSLTHVDTVLTPPSIISQSSAKSFRKSFARASSTRAAMSCPALRPFSSALASTSFRLWKLSCVCGEPPTQPDQEAEAQRRMPPQADLVSTISRRRPMASRWMSGIFRVSFFSIFPAGAAAATPGARQMKRLAFEPPGYHSNAPATAAAHTLCPSTGSLSAVV